MVANTCGRHSGNDIADHQQVVSGSLSDVRIGTCCKPDMSIDLAADSAGSVRRPEVTSVLQKKCNLPNFRPLAR